ncbi:hypothetical protein HW260_11550 (plasmid) [Helicobacter cinaedi]|uniref:relaxase/mobilization nuclease domain-containing protein n=1 Tax=Helicobacter cinaedi TaxID=213 RepID=UPI0018A3E0A8|nr:hypothetical protein [Helicobacter cinaedi]QOQ91998.1 hypothetical protein HW260_11550 [Helicobacter cinaedi]
MVCFKNTRYNIFMKKFARLKNIFFDYEEEKRKKIKDEVVPKKRLELFSSRLFSVIQERKFAKQVMIKLLSNLSAKGVKNALNYVIRNSESTFALNQDNELVSLEDIMNDWQKDFSPKENAKEAWHFTFSLDEAVDKHSLEALKISVSEVMKKNFFEYKFVSVIHSHQNKPHIHIILNKNNIFSRKKLHFKSKQDIKDFWNLLREDFKNSLNFHNPNLNYENKYKFERDLLKQHARASLEIPLNINNEISKSMHSIVNKISLYESKIQTINEAIRQKVATKILLVNEAKELMASGNKLYYKKLKLVKSHNSEISELKQSLQDYKTKIKALRVIEKELNYERLSYKMTMLHLPKKQAYLKFLESNVTNKNYSKNDVYLISQIKNDLFVNEAKLEKHLKENLELDLLLSNSLNKKSNVFTLINMAKDLEYHLNAINRIDISLDLNDKIQAYTHKLNKNKDFVINLCKEKQNNLLKGERSKFKENELKALSQFLNTPYTFESTQEKISSAKIEKTKMIVDSRLDIDEFIDWYCKKQDIRNKSFYEASLKEKIQANTFENFKQLYKEFEYDRVKGISR